MSKVTVETIKPLGDRFVTEVFCPDKNNMVLAGITHNSLINVFFESSIDNIHWTKIETSEYTFSGHDDFALYEVNPKLLIRINLSKIPNQLIVL